MDNGFLNNRDAVDNIGAAPNRDIVIVISGGFTTINFDAGFTTGTVDLLLAQASANLDMLNGGLTGGPNGKCRFERQMR